MAAPHLYHLLQVAAQRARKHADQRGLGAAGVTAAQGGALFAIEAAPGLSQRRLARMLAQQESAVATMVARLLAAGLITRTGPSPASRGARLEITERGRAALAALRQELARINDAFAAALTPEERRVLGPALQKLASISWG